MSFLKGAMLTGAVISSWVDNARTKKDVKRIYQQTSEANFVSRGVLALPHVNKLQLLLTTKDESDNDVYVYESNSTTPAVDFIWGEAQGPENTIISGGKPDERVRSLMPFVHKSQQEGLPIFVLHSSNRDLKAMIEEHSIDCEFLSQTELYYDGFRALPVEDMSYLLFETMPENTSPSAESVLRALLEVVLCKEGKITFHNLAAFPLVRLMDTLNTLKADGEITVDEYDDISRDYMAGSSEIDGVRNFLSKLNRQADSIFGKPRAKSGNIKKMLNTKGVVAIDVGLGSNELVISFAINQIKLLQAAGKDFAIALDGLALSKFPSIYDILRGRTYAICHNDFVSSLYGGEKKGEDMFTEIAGDVSAMILFNHKSGTSCQKWSEHVGKYHKIRIKMNISQTKNFLTGGNTRGISVDETDEPRVRAETLSMLPNAMACIYKKDGILFAEV